MYAVADDLAGHTRISEEDAHGPRVAVEQRWHRVEEVRRHGRARINGSAGSIAIGRSVAHCGDGATLDDEADGLKGAREFGGQRHHANATVARVEDARDLIRGRIPQRARVMRAAVGRGDPGPFEVDAAQCAVVNEGDESSHLADQVVVLRRYEARMHRRRAVSAVRRRGRGNLVRVGRGEGSTAATVTVQVDEAGEQDIRADGMLRGRPRPDLHDRIALDPHPGIRPLAVGIDDALRGEHERHAPTLGHPRAG